MDDPPTIEGSSSRWSSVGRAAGVVLVVAISVTIFLLRDQVEELKALGYLGAFAVMLLGNATVILPAPGLTIVFALGAALDPLALGIASGAGAALGELTGYVAGLSGRSVVQNRALYKRFEHWMDRFGPAALFLLATFPNPFFDVAGLAAGALRYPWWRFLLLAWAGKTVQGILIAYAGAASAGWVLEWLSGLMGASETGALMAVLWGGGHVRPPVVH
jgi:uncharacterized membrane protein YdjX (TVP38/TMEM64 family)